MLIRLLHFEKFVRHYHRLVSAPFVVTGHVEEAVLQGYPDRIVAMAVGLSADGPMVVAWWLLLLGLLVPNRLLAPVAWRF